MNTLRRLSAFGLALAYAHSVFGAIVRISGSGMGCGEHWPDCNGSVVPVITSYTVAVEATHRVLAATLLAVALALAILAAARRHTPGVGGAGGVLRPALLALGLIITAALIGMLVVKISLSNPYLIVVHYSIAMATLAALVVAYVRARRAAIDGAIAISGSASTYRASLAAATMAFVTVVLGALTANFPGAASSCRGFPTCRGGVMVTGAPLDIQLLHRLLAFILFFHVLGLVIGVTRRSEPPPVVRAAQIAGALVVAQVAIAAAMVELRLPPVLQSLHQAAGTLLWIVLFALVLLSRRRALQPQRVGPAPDLARPRSMPA
jgi:heme A synthase